MDAPTAAAVALLAGTTTFLSGYYFLSPAAWRARLQRARRDATPEAVFLASKLSLGALYLTAGAALVAACAPQRLTTLLPRVPAPRALAATVALAAAALPLGRRWARRPEAWALLPELRVAPWSPQAARTAALGWSAYLLGYEALFRGALLVPLEPAMGRPLALAVHAAVYALAHLHKAPGEAFGTLLVGPVFAWVALTDGSTQLVVALHVALALTAEYTAARARDAAG